MLTNARTSLWHRTAGGRTTSDPAGKRGHFKPSPQPRISIRWGRFEPPPAGPGETVLAGPGQHHPKSTEDLLRILRDDQSARDLRTYFSTAAPDRPPLYAGSRFDTLDGGGSRPDTRDRITAADLLAVQCLSVAVPAPVSLNLLEGHLGIQVSGLLRHVPASIELGEPGSRDHVLPGSPADQAWHLLTEQDGVGWVTAWKLMARKRPRLIPVWDHVVRCAMNYPDNCPGMD